MSFVLVIYFWCTCVAINNVIVQCNGGFLYDITVDTIMLLPLANTIKFHEKVCPCSQCSYLYILTILSPGWVDAQKIWMRSDFSLSNSSV